MSEESIFAGALERSSPEERTAYLDEVCAGDSKLRQRMEALLHSHEKAGEFLQVPAPEEYSFTQLPNDTDVPSAVIGPYKLLQQIGEGGFGIVYMAEQRHPVQRKVAFKIIKPGMDTAEVVARFEGERQALALMDHENIARVIDGGSTDTGRPYFVMDLIKGVPITEFCDDNHLNLRERLELFIPICHAIQHAHQKGVIHRDIKPSNVLVTMIDGRAVPKIIDFGVAKAVNQRLTERTLFTRFGQIVGTLQYMSPEQAEMSGLDVDTRSDIYSLGVLLYELLTGTTPVEKQKLRQAAFTEMQRMLREDEPPKPSTRISESGDALPSIAACRRVEPKKLGKLLRGDLDWIVMKALDKDRGRRYETADGFALDIQRCLQDEPVLAGPPSTLYRLGKFGRKHKKFLATGLAFVAVLLLGAVVSTVLAFRASTAQRLADNRLVEVTTQRNLAKDALAQAQKAKKASDKALSESQQAREHAEKVTQYLLNAFRSPDPDRNGRLITVAEMFDRAVQELKTEFPDSPILKASLLEAMGDTYLGLGLPHSAEELHAQALKLRTKELGDDHLHTLRSMRKLGVAHQNAGNLQQALQIFETALQTTRETLGEDHLWTLGAMNNLAQAHRNTHDPKALKKAVSLMEEVLERSQKKLDDHSPTLLIFMNTLGSIFRMQEEFDKAIPLLEETLRRTIKKMGENHSER